MNISLAGKTDSGREESWCALVYTLTQECFWQQDCHTLPKKEQEQQSVNALADINNQYGIQMALLVFCDIEKNNYIHQGEKKISEWVKITNKYIEILLSQ